jgi:hypothetical protein
LRFSLLQLLLGVVVVAVCCAAVRWFWRYPLAVALLAAVGLAAIVWKSGAAKTMTLGIWHLVVWLVLGTGAAVLAARACVQYNEVAGTDKTPKEIAIISAAVFTGPMVGPVTNPAAGEEWNQSALRWTIGLLIIVLLSLCPFLFLRRPVHRAVAVISWIGFVGASVLWFFAALVSMGMFLS